jgi:hypothetical protein
MESKKYRYLFHLLYVEELENETSIIRKRNLG